MTILECSYNKAQTYYNFHPVYVNKPFDLFGATVELFYSSHAVPALGLKLRVKDLKKQNESSVFISGDTLSKRMITTLNDAGVYSKTRYDELMGVLPEDPCFNILFVDAGSGSIHGDPDDYFQSGCQIVYMHTGKNLSDLPPKHQLLKAGQYFIIHQ